MTPVRTRWILLAAALFIILILISSVFFSSIFISLGLIPPVIHTPDGFIIMTAAIPAAPQSLPIYRGSLQEGDPRYLTIGSNASGQKIVSIEEAPALAQSILEQQGIFPNDTEPPVTHIQKGGEVIDDVTGKILEQFPGSISVSFYHRIDNLPVFYGDVINVDFEENGNVSIYKRWRDIEYTGKNVSIIPPHAVFNKISHGEILDRPMCCLGIFSVKKITYGYYEKHPVNPSIEDPVIDLEPVWILSGSLADGDPWDMTILARAL